MKKSPFVHSLILASLCAFLCPVGLLAAVPNQEGTSIDDRYLHLGDSTINDWPGVSREPDGTEYRIPFSLSEAATGMTLRLRHRDVHHPWTMRLNGEVIGGLKIEGAEDDYFYPLPMESLRTGENVLEIAPENNTDDIAIGNARLYELPMRELLSLVPVRIEVKDADTGEPVPARIHVQRVEGGPAEFFFADPTKTAIRSGLLYTTGAATTVEVPRGEYTFTATRGMEWSRAESTIDLDEAKDLSLELRHEVKTPGFIAADTHIHTYTFSGHGNATVEERMVTLAAEGVELAVATDHNHHTDYRPYQERLKLNSFFTPVTGNEVTTPNGHFNAFPMDPDGEIPPYQELDWVKLVDGIRQKGAQVVILNHPRWPDLASGPFGRFGLNRGSGERASGGAFTFDGMEAINSTTLLDDPFYLVQDWFSLLNRGDLIFAVGSSDSHTVEDPVGQGRTYIRSGTDDPAAIDVDEVVQHLKQGRASVSLGIFADVTVNGEYSMGDTVVINDAQAEIDLHVAAPSWIKPTTALIYVNGREVASQSVPSESGEPTDANLNFKIRVPGYDAHLVCLVLGEGVDHPGWEIMADYTLALTNPVFLDTNGDGEYSPLIDAARKVMASLHTDMSALMMTLELIEPELGVQMATLALDRLTGAKRNAVLTRLERLAAGNNWYEYYLRHLNTEEPDASGNDAP